MSDAPRLAPAIAPLRARQAAAVVADPTRVIIVSGGSGLGKTALLETARADPQAGIAPPTFELYRSADLGDVLLRRLGAALDQLADQQDPAALAVRLAEAIGRLGGEVGREVAAAAALQLLDIATGGLASKVREPLRRLRDDFAKNAPTGTAAELAAVLRPDALQLIVSFGTATLDWADGRPVTLSVEQAQHLDEHGRRLLADLSERLPKGLKVHATWRTANERERGGLDELLADAPALGHLALAPFHADDVQRWLGSAPVAGLSAVELVQRTGGNPLIVSDVRRASAALPAGTDIFAATVQQRVQGLSTDAKLAVARLVSIALRPPDRAIEQIAELDGPTWSAVEAELMNVGLLSPSAAGPWFHELRREALISLVADERPYGLGMTVHVLFALAVADDRWLGPLLWHARRFDGLWSDLIWIRDADWEHLALLAAATELGPAPYIGVSSGQLVHYAREHWGGVGPDPAVALQTLVERGLLSDGNYRAGPLVLSLSSTARTLLRARAIEARGRAPVDHVSAALTVGLAEHLAAVSDETLPEARQLKVVLGSWSTRELILWSVIPPIVDGEADPPALLAHGSFRSVAISAVLTYQSQGDRDAAAAMLNDLSVPVEDDRLIITSALWPAVGAVPGDRLLRAAERAFGLARDELPYGSDDQAEPAAPTVELMQRRYDAYMAVGRASLELERWAYDLPDRFALVWSEEGDWLTEIEVVGGRCGSIEARPIADGSRQGLLSEVRFHEAIDLGPGETLGSSRYRSSRPSDTPPEHTVFERLADRAAEWNEHFDAVDIDLTASSLEADIAQALNDELRLARRLHEQLVGERGGVPEAKCLVLLVPASRAASGMWINNEPWGVYAWIRSTTPSRVMAINGLPHAEDDLFRYVEALSNVGVGRDVESFGISPLYDLVASTLGFRLEQLRFRNPPSWATGL